MEKLIYISHTSPDIAHVVGVVSRFMHKPLGEHMETVMWKETPRQGILSEDMNIWMWKFILMQIGQTTRTIDGPLYGISH